MQNGYIYVERSRPQQLKEVENKFLSFSLSFSCLNFEDLFSVITCHRTSLKIVEVTLKREISCLCKSFSIYLLCCWDQIENL